MTPVTGLGELRVTRRHGDTEIQSRAAQPLCPAASQWRLSNVSNVTISPSQPLTQRGHTEAGEAAALLDSKCST